jgi:periplasmic divalent cation tolerance protein
MIDQVCEVVITADNEEWLLNFTRSLVSDRLAACGQHITPIRSIYRWNNEIQHDRETRVALHTRLDLVPAILERVNREHPYDVPCVLALPVATGNPAYLDWVIAETGGSS